MKPFKFKEFTVHQDKAAMKIGTDAVLLGAWSDINFYPDSILDVGSGTGVIALMLAQRTDAMTIDAIEIDEAAYEQSVENFERSDWGDRLFCYHASFQEFADEMQEDEETYDVIISNPPFYNAEFLSEDESRNKARFTNTALSFEELIKGVSVLLSETGEFNVIIPFEEEKSFVDLAKEHKLLVNRICRVRGNVNSELKRSLLAFSFEDKELVEEELVIEKERHQYTDAYIDLTKDFYLKM
ncbi:tRNA1(Val) (adenine(37)-N6)-methyltransferase [Tenacibaculum jejuense]|uniref:tRNA1(Val) (adenine(37)-N6)-methyltransferase n=1 Tax=Tenacibaculum jejuense TaxID=584609 RepID=A0A238UE64_9FLAO|nr:methyltransferase [Tenacibaculum jejuense]SNR17296.1 tRNA1(Val) (adenine(37)-N6)-methyltransferase [Tenacibaculum jejuense]